MRGHPQEQIWENPGKPTLNLGKGEFCPGQSWLDVGVSYPSKELYKHKLNYSLLEKVEKVLSPETLGAE